MNPNSQGNCWYCGRRLSAAEYARESRCPDCDKATHVCHNCRFHKPGLANDCAEPMAERVNDKDRPNFCDYFEPREQTAADQGRDSATDLLKAAEDLFK